MPLLGTNVDVIGTASYEDTAGSDLVIITAGMTRKPGMSRDDLVYTNSRIITSVTEQVVRYSPETIILVLSNPVDAMTYVALKMSGLPKHKVIGQAGVLDTARFKTFVADELHVAAEDVEALVLGVHGDSMVPLVRYSHIKGVPLEQLIPKDRIEAIAERTKYGGAEIVNLLGSGSAYYAPAASLAYMAESILLDKQRLLPAIAYLEGEYGYKNLVLGVPVILGGNGIERVVEINLLPVEREALDKSTTFIKSFIKSMHDSTAQKSPEFLT